MEERKLDQSVIAEILIETGVLENDPDVMF